MDRIRGTDSLPSGYLEYWNQDHYQELGTIKDPIPDIPAFAQLLVNQRHVKRIKTALESQHLFNKRRGIERHSLASKAFGEPYMSICTNILLPLKDGSKAEDPWPRLKDDESWQVLQSVFEKLGLEDIKSDIKVTYYYVSGGNEEVEESNTVLKALRKGLEALPQDLLFSIGVTVDALVHAFPASYTIYRPMLLLPHNAFTVLFWPKLLEAHPLQSPRLQSLWEAVAASVGVTHIAVNAGIPLQTTCSSITDTSSNENILRSPTHLTPIYGSFGPPPSAQTLSSPTPDDFRNALWVEHTQNGIHQTWAPLYTMFSRGNIREKTRLLTLPSVTTSVQDPKGCTAVDLYAGIGYFAFSYRKAEVSKVLCWELNPWSIKGLRRGAALNGWKTSHFGSNSQLENLNEESDFLVFAQSNEYALEILPRVQRGMTLPPIRHVNCGFLPSSKMSWRTAVGMLDKELGGWIHAHENVGVNDIETRKVEVVTEMERHLEQGELRGEVRCEHVEKVKTYAPGVLHIVFDVWIGPTQGLEGRGR